MKVKKKIIKKIICIIIAVILVITGIFAIYALKTEKATVAYNGVLDLGITTSGDGLIAKTAVSYLYDTYKGGNCSVAVKTLENGDNIVGRNLDMTMSNYPVYIGRTSIEGYYDTIYAGYLAEFGPEYDKIIKSGVPNYIKKIMPFIALDSLNSEGLYIQINMRMDQTDEDGNNVFSCAYTNKDSDTRISAIELPTYVTLRAKDVNEAVELIKSLDIYTLGGDVNWPFSYIIADADGNCGLLELGANEARWIPDQNLQTNFYISEDLGKIQKYKQGIGRYEYIESNLSDVNSEQDMLNILKGVKYSSIYDIDNQNFDIRSEMTGEEDYITNEYLDNDDNWNAYLEEYKKYVDTYNSLSLADKKDKNEYWFSVYSVIVNCTKKSITFSFFENYDSALTLNFRTD